MEMRVRTSSRFVCAPVPVKSASRNMAFSRLTGSNFHIPVTPFHRWDEKTGLQRDAIRSQCSACSRHKEKETGYEKDWQCSGKWKHSFQRTQAHDWSGPRRSLVVLLYCG